MRRTPEGVALLEARDEEGFVRALGAAHAHDRALQMVLTRLIGQGRLGECLKANDETHAVDVFMRQVGFAHGAGREVELLGEARPLVEAYCEGVNEVLARRRPWELALAGHRPEPWTPADVLLTVRLMSYIGLAQTQQDAEKLIAQAVHDGVDLARLKALFAPHLDGLTEEIAALLRTTRIELPFFPEEVRFLPGLLVLKASNNWAVAAFRSASGSALQANDPHLEVNRLPAIWYEVAARVREGDRFLLGVTVPGAPGLAMGRSRDVSAGFTYGFMDMVDYFLEEVRGGTVRRGDAWAAVTERRETIRRRKGGDVTLALFSTDVGTLETRPERSALEDGLYLCRAWSFERGGAAATIRSLLALWRARDVDEAQRALHGCALSANWLLADRGGRIAYQQTGALPLRAHSGLHPLPAWNEACRWRGLADGASLASERDPASGLLVTANEERDGTNLAMGDYRVARARALLLAKEKLTLDDMKAVQRDLGSLQAERLLALLAPHLPDTPAGRLLSGWDRRYDAASKGAVLFERLYEALLHEVMSPLFGEAAWRTIACSTVVFAEFFHLFDRVLLEGDEALWFGSERRAALLSRVARAVLPPELSVKTLPTWGASRGLLMKNVFFDGKLPAFLGFDRGPFALEGGRATLVQGQLLEAGGRTTSFAPSWRYVTDMGTDEAETALAGGPSDRRFSGWYDTDVARWLSYRYKKLRAVG